MRLADRAAQALDPEPAKAVCRRCDVQDECGQAGMAEPFGVWGGLDESQRRRLARQLAAVAR